MPISLFSLNMDKYLKCWSIWCHRKLVLTYKKWWYVPSLYELFYIHAIFMVIGLTYLFKMFARKRDILRPYWTSLNMKGILGVRPYSKTQNFTYYQKNIGLWISRLSLLNLLYYCDKFYSRYHCLLWFVCTLFANKPFYNSAVSIFAFILCSVVVHWYDWLLWRSRKLNFANIHVYDPRVELLFIS